VIDVALFAGLVRDAAGLRRQRDVARLYLRQACFRAARASAFHVERDDVAGTGHRCLRAFLAAVFGAAGLYIGLFWMALTVAFEFLFFHYVGGHPWPALLANYDLLNGRIWVLLLAWIAIAPYVFDRCKNPSAWFAPRFFTNIGYGLAW
jgi:hypothetical protein